jgi:hypothetical protein
MGVDLFHSGVPLPNLPSTPAAVDVCGKTNSRHEASVVVEPKVAGLRQRIELVIVGKKRVPARVVIGGQ